MAAHSGPNISNSGLVFHFDMDNTVKSWKGKPTENLQDPDFNNWSSSATINILQIKSPVNHTVYEIIDDNTGLYLNASRSLTVPDDSSTYTYSIYIKKTSGGTSARLGFNYGLTGGATIIQRNARFNSDTGAAVQGSAEDLGEWWRWQFSITNNSTGNTNLYCRFYPATGFYDSGDNPQATGTAIVSGMQIEQNSFATPFVVDTRSNTEAILDLSGAKTITPSNLSYNSDNTFGFDGTDDYLTLSSSIDTYDKSFTLEAWIKRSVAGVEHGIIGDLQYNWFQFFVTGGNKIYNRFGYYDNGTTRNEVSGSTNIGTDWTHVAVTFENGVGQKIYVNGELDGLNTDGNPFALTGGSRGPRYLGRADNNAFGSNPAYFNGQIANFKGYSDRALDANEIKKNYNATRGRYGI